MSFLKKSLMFQADICECGVFKGSGIFTWVKLMMLFKPNNKFNVVGFDLFKNKKKKLKFKYKIDKKFKLGTCQEQLKDLKF